ncbi:hypothetical protein BH160DRAFT_3234 [Burkholderia sp. H160]|nr:hypothetical protein BH160DRAFT_3234 [Burkholderia sp. H160]
MRAQKDNSYGWSDTANPVKKVETIGIRIAFEFVIAHKDVNWHFTQQLDQAANAFSFEADLDVRTRLKKMLDAEENEWMIVGNSDSYFVHSHSLTMPVRIFFPPKTCTLSDQCKMSFRATSRRTASGLMQV